MIKTQMTFVATGLMVGTAFLQGTAEAHCGEHQNSCSAYGDTVLLETYCGEYGEDYSVYGVTEGYCTAAVGTGGVCGAGPGSADCSPSVPCTNTELECINGRCRGRCEFGTRRGCSAISSFQVQGSPGGECHWGLPIGAGCSGEGMACNHGYGACTSGVCTSFAGCNNNGVCSGGETFKTCPHDCVTGPWYCQSNVTVGPSGFTHLTSGYSLCGAVGTGYSNYGYPQLAAVTNEGGYGGSLSYQMAQYVLVNWGPEEVATIAPDGQSMEWVLAADSSPLGSWYRGSIAQGEWFYNSGSCSVEVEPQNGTVVAVINEWGDKQRAIQKANVIVVPGWGNLTGTISNHGQTLAWANDTTWTRSFGSS